MAPQPRSFYISKYSRPKFLPMYWIGWKSSIHGEYRRWPVVKAGLLFHMKYASLVSSINNYDQTVAFILCLAQIRGVRLEVAVSVEVHGRIRNRSGKNRNYCPSLRLDMVSLLVDVYFKWVTIKRMCSIWNCNKPHTFYCYYIDPIF